MFFASSTGTRRKPLARPGARARPDRAEARPAGESGTPCGREQRPAAEATPCGREDRTPQSRAGTKAQALVARSKSCTAIKTRLDRAGGIGGSEPVASRGRSPGSGVLTFSLSGWLCPCLCSCLCSCSAGDSRAAQGSPTDRRAGGAKRTWAAQPKAGLRPNSWAHTTHPCGCVPRQCWRGFEAQTPVSGLVQLHPRNPLC